MNVIAKQPVAASAAPKGWKVSTSGQSLSVLSRQWIARRPDERFTSLDDLMAATRRRADQTQELRILPGQIEVLSPEVSERDSRETILGKAQELRLGLPGGREIAPTHWAFGQVAGLARAPSAYLRQLPTPIVADALQYGLRYNRDGEVKLYHDEIEAMAATGPDYGRIFDHEVAEAVQMATAGAAGDHRWKVPGTLDWATGRYDPHTPVTSETTTLFASDRGVFVFLCQDLAPIEIGKLPSGEPDLVFRGFYVTNSEVGAGSLKLGAMYLRAVCQNRILWGVEGFEEMTMRHVKTAPARFMEEARPALESFANHSTGKLLDGIAKARAAKVADDKAATLSWLAGRNVSRKRAMAIYDRIVQEERGGDDEDRPVSAWDLAQGITAQARSEPNADARMELELDAKRVLDNVAAA